MYELATWIDKSLTDISQEPLFDKYFLNQSIEDIEGYFYITNKTKGIDVAFSEELLVDTIHLTNNHLDYNEFKDELPFKIKFHFNRQEIRKLLGEPGSTGGGCENVILGYILPWDKYFYDSYSLHVRYAIGEDYIEQVSLGSLKFEENALPE